MKTCIYCKETNEEFFKGVEHLIPQSFGTFSSETPTLKCVCDKCNAYFGKELDQVFARDSWEGVNRYKKGIKSSEQRPVKRLKFTLDKTPEMGEFGGMVFEGVDSTTGKLLQPKGQFHIPNKKTKEVDVFLLDEIKNAKFDSETYETKNLSDTKILASSKENHQAVIDELKKVGINFKVRETFSAPFVEGKKDDDKIELPIFVEGRVDNPIKRALVKILLNFVAFYVGEDEILKPEWDSVRKFVRLGEGKISGKLDNKPFLGEETENVRYQNDSFNIVVENNGNNVWGKIQIYNFYTYIFILAENYNLPPDKEKGMRFTKGKPPFLLEKRTRD